MAKANPKPKTASSSPADMSTFLLVLKMGRPKFLMYSMACHLVGILVAMQQGCSIEWQTAGYLQLTIWLTHVMTHYINEYGDYDVDKLNTNAGAWTGGSKVLKDGLLPRSSALAMAWVLFALSIVFGACTVYSYIVFRRGIPITTASFSSPEEVLTILSAFPWQFLLLGFSVFAVAVAYSLPPLRLSAVGLGEVCVSYVLTFAAPAVGLLIQDGTVTRHFIYLLLPIFLINASRMIVMNIPDRAGDEAGGKVTSVVLVGEDKAVLLNTFVYVATYLWIMPLLPLSYNIRCAYYAPLPLRWWQSLRVNVPHWWTNQDLADSIPFVESMYVLVSVTSLCVGLAADLGMLSASGIGPS